METNNKPFRKFWVKEVNGWLCDADYNGKRLKYNNPLPTFRKFWFIKAWEDLKGFKLHEGHENRVLVEKWLAAIENELQMAYAWWGGLNYDTHKDKLSKLGLTLQDMDDDKNDSILILLYRSHALQIFSTLTNNKP